MWIIEKPLQDNASKVQNDIMQHLKVENSSSQSAMHTHTHTLMNTQEKINVITHTEHQLMTGKREKHGGTSAVKVIRIP